MASKESARYSGLMSKLEFLRNQPPAVLLVSTGCSTAPANSDLLMRLKGFSAATHHFSSLIDVVVNLSKTTLRVDNVRFNRWGKVEIHLPEMVHVLKALKASQEEVEKLSWLVFPAYGDEQLEACREAAAAFLSDKKPSLSIRLYDLSLVKDNASTEVNAFAPVCKKEIVYGRWQILKHVLPPTGEKESVSGASVEVDVSKAKAKASSDESCSSKEPPRKRAKKSGAGEKEKEKEKEDSPIVNERALDGQDDEEPIRGE